MIFHNCTFSLEEDKKSPKTSFRAFKFIWIFFIAFCLFVLKAAEQNKIEEKLSFIHFLFKTIYKLPYM